ncbi:sel1 repeat family protein [Acinetobacter sp. 2JN-4]|uniref:tetratricopeptide repeat protein n=1 Tax=Acinetobacter sp. 2JN-4 TaxID=2479844 RepID=UPI000EF9C24B|nr:tetratricopeptide repeat protein [Acinetobacter sp. 2JN-4]RLZ10097.1 sel1 repeat family protein [Acinetobacter sp. 2JN-4]
MNLKKYYLGVFILFLGFVGFNYLKHNWNYLSASYKYHFKELSADELNQYAALQYYKNINDHFRSKEDEITRAKKALEVESLFEQAADKGSTLAKLNLVTLYLRKKEEIPVSQIFQLSKEAAEAGNADAQFRVGVLFHQGFGTDINYQKAMYWYKKAVEQGNPAGMNNIGVLYQRGLGVEQNGKISTEWYIKAANLGYANGIENMFQNYYRGLNGLPENEEEAMRWREMCYYRSEDIPIQPVFDFNLNIKETYPNTCKS